MKPFVWMMASSVLFLAACDSLTNSAEDPNESFIQELPESITAIAAPNQDLTAVRIDPVDGCYVYRYVGPVETTFLPLRTVEGRPICGPKPEPAPQS